MNMFRKNFLMPKRRTIIFLFFGFLVICAMCFATGLYAASLTDGTSRFKLDNGFTVILKENHTSPVASIQVWVKAGSANETDKEAGITHLIEHMIFKGTPTRKTGEIARTIEASGGRINAYTSLDRTVYYVESASSHFDTGLNVLLDAVQHSLFDMEELEREKEVVLEEYRRALDNPNRRLSKAMMSLSYKKHPYRRPVIGYEETIRSFDREAILKYIDKWYTPNNMVLVAVGDFDADRALNTIRSLIKDFPKGTGRKPSRPEEPEQTSLRKTILNEEVQQVYLDMSWHIPALTHDHMPALDILEIILGHGESCRLYRRLKMQESLVHHIDAGAYALADPGLFSIDATLRPENLNDALGSIVQEIVEITHKPVSEADIKKAKNIVEAHFVFAMESMSGQARALAFFETMTGDMFNSDKYVERIKQVTAHDIRKVACIYLKPENLSIGVLAPKGAGVVLSGQQITALFSKMTGASDAKRAGIPELDQKCSMVTLKNGLRLIIKENHNLPVVSIRAAFLGGVRLEDPYPWGISAFVSEMLTRGTNKRTFFEIASTIDSWAGSLSGFSGKNSFGISAKFLSKDLYPGLELLADVLFNPAFPESEMEKVRKDILAAIREKKDRPTPQLFDLFYKTLFQHHPYGHPQTGTAKTIRSITRTDLVQWYESRAIPSNLVLAVAGDVNKEQLVPHVRMLFGKLRPTSTKPSEIPSEPPLMRIREVHLYRPGAQTHFVIGYIGADLLSRDNAPMALLETALSGQGGRLFFKLRDKQSLAYSVTAFRRPGLETGVFGVYLACDPSKLSVAKEGVLRELEKIRKDGLSKIELEAAKKYLLGKLKIRLQTNGNQSMHMALNELYGLGYDDLRRYIEDIKAVTLEDIDRVARKIIVPDKYVFVTAGPALK